MIRDVYSNELFTILLVLGLVIIALAKLTAPKRFEDFLYVLGNSKYLKIYSRDQKFFDKFDALLFGNLILCLVVFSFILYQKVIDFKTIDINILFKFITGIGAFILIKVLTERLIGSLFEIDKIIDEYLFQKISYKNYLGLLLLPINAILLFSFQDSLNLVYVFVTILLIVNIIGLITSFKTHQSLIKNNLFYFILYLCALEIAPYVILYKVFIS
ncbi:MAG: DUF4271 domain-containing protein [Flavobacteriaceae bacterium]|tara:strand:- start:12837 stop:13481 length:645 start_codon:yes stop_codon:yes gene_type:complete